MVYNGRVSSESESEWKTLMKGSIILIINKCPSICSHKIGPMLPLRTGTYRVQNISASLYSYEQNSSIIKMQNFIKHKIMYVNQNKEERIIQFLCMLNILVYGHKETSYANYALGLKSTWQEIHLSFIRSIKIFLLVWIRI